MRDKFLNREGEGAKSYRLLALTTRESRVTGHQKERGRLASAPGFVYFSECLYQGARQVPNVPPNANTTFATTFDDCTSTPYKQVLMRLGIVIVTV